MTEIEVTVREENYVAGRNSGFYKWWFFWGDGIHVKVGPTRGYTKKYVKLHCLKWFKENRPDCVPVFDGV